MKVTVFYFGLAASALLPAACTTTGNGKVENPSLTAAAPAATPPISPSSAPVSSFKETAKVDPVNVIPYPFTTCAVIRKDYEGHPKHRRVYNNHEVLFCCTPCLKAFDANPEAYMPRIVAAAAAKARGETVSSGW